VGKLTGRRLIRILITRMRTSALLIALALMGCESSELGPLPTPIAVAGPDQTVSLTLDEDGVARARVALDGTGSFVPGAPSSGLSYAWRVIRAGSGTTISVPADARTEAVIEGHGLHTFELAVRIDGRASLPSSVSILAEPPRQQNTAPLPVIEVRPEQPVVGVPVELDGRASRDPDSGDRVVSHRWLLRRGDEEQRLPAEPLVTFTPVEEGIYRARLTVMDLDLVMASVEVSFQVRACEVRGEEVCDGNRVDEDCDGMVDEGFDLDDDGVSSCGGDCDDEDATRSPSALEICDGRDNNCDGVIDEGFDGDGDGVTLCGGDCDDEDPGIHPGKVEECDGIDQDCDGEVDEGFDADGDGWTACGGDCVPDDPEIHPGADDLCDGFDSDCDDADGVDRDGDGWSSCQEDCDDDRMRHPGRAEIPDNGFDENCDGVDDPPVCADDDGDGYCALLPGCDPTPAGCREGWDCNDRVDAIHPGADEVCDRRDNDCDGTIDEGFDVDGDRISSCQGDCDDQRDDVCPICPEVCDGVDNNCDGRLDEGFDEACSEDCTPGDPCAIEACPGGSAGTVRCESRQGQVIETCEPALIVRSSADVGCGTYRRDGWATYVSDGDGLVGNSPPDRPRFQHDPTTGRRHLLLEGPRTNLLYDTETPGVNEEGGDPYAWVVHSQGEGGPTTAEVVDAGAPDRGAYTELGLPSDRGGIRLYLNGVTEPSAPVVHSAWLKSRTGTLISQRDEPRYDWPLGPEWTRHVALGSRDDVRTRLFLRRWDDLAGPPETEDLGVWGLQIEEGSFASTYIPRPTAGSRGIRGADALGFAPEVADTDSGTWVAWIRSLHSADQEPGVQPFFDIGGTATFALDGRGEAPTWTCSVGEAIASTPAHFVADAWLFLACAWDAEGGVLLLTGTPPGDLDRALVGGPLAGPPPGGDQVRLTPTWGLIGEVRLYQRALSEDDLLVHQAMTEAGYR
jgi:hypothetical protein